MSAHISAQLYTYSLTLGLFLFYKYFGILVLEWIYSFILELSIAIRYHFWGFDICKVGYVEREYAIIAGILGIK